MPAAKTSAKPSTLSKLTEKFAENVYRTNPKGFLYIPIEQTIQRFNEVLGAGWSLFIESVDFTLMPGMTYGRQQKPAGSAVVQVKIVCEMDGTTVTRSGVGADFGAADDPDKLVKTALAEAIKKCGNEYGIGLELWDAEERAAIEEAQRTGVSAAVVQHPAADELTELKNRVADLAVAAGVERTGPAIAAHFGISVEALQDRAELEKIVASAESAVASI